LEAAFRRDATRVSAFEPTFRRVRAERNPEKLLSLIRRRLAVASTSEERAKLQWEEARALREQGKLDDAFDVLERVRSLEPNHVGALALMGEIHIRKGAFEAAARVLGDLSGVETAPARNRVTAAIAAVDLLENKLSRYDRSFKLLAAIHEAGLSTLPIRERLARAAAKTESWEEATAVLGILMKERTEKSGRVEAARLSMRIHVEKGLPPSSLREPIRSLLFEVPDDREAIEVLLTSGLSNAERVPLIGVAKGGLIKVLGEAPTVSAALLLGRLAAHQHDAALMQSARAIALSLGNLESAPELASPASLLADGEHGLLSLCTAEGDLGPYAQLFRALGETLGEAFGESAASLGLTKKDRIDSKSAPIIFDALNPLFKACAVNISSFEFYVGGPDPFALRVLPGEKPALIVGGQVDFPLARASVAKLASELIAFERGTSFLLQRPLSDVVKVIQSACSLGKITGAGAETDLEQRLSKAMSRKLRNQLPDLCQTFASKNIPQEAEQWTRAALMTIARVAYCFSLDLVFCAAIVVENASGDLFALREARALVQFALSEAYLTSSFGSSRSLS
jgi:cellulose synthase operon protein C